MWLVDADCNYYDIDEINGVYFDIDAKGFGELEYIQVFEVYQIRWNIEVMNKETKQYLGLGGYQGCNFNGQIADATLCYLTYTVMALEKRFTEYQTMGELFSDMV